MASQIDPATHRVAIAIRDSGLGMEAHELASVFAAFVQGDHAKKPSAHRFGGLGLDLAISKALVEMHHGTVEARSEGRGQGSTFTISLPLAAGSSGAPNSTRGAPAALSDHAKSPAALALGPRPRILLVEDHGPTRVSLSHLLKRRGYVVVAVASADGALKEVTSSSFDLVLSDIGLPDDSGFVLMRKLHDRHGLNGIALTGYGMERDLARSREAGFLTHLTKPISVDMLDRALAEALAAPA